ncbi:MAG TPA: hypothetical protein VM532_15900 [Burkholderiales bacterium]|nr:hypothetical protein [Burkholderiales bacterium]
MKVGETVTTEILAREKWSDTRISIVAGEEYHFKSSGQWNDKTIVCGADGYASPNLLLRASEFLRRVPSAPWFALIGSIDRNEDAFFLLGAEATITPQSTGTLYCFANDVSFMYWNNTGGIQLSVTRVR